MKRVEKTILILLNIAHFLLLSGVQEKLFCIYLKQFRPDLTKTSYNLVTARSGLNHYMLFNIRYTTKKPICAAPNERGWRLPPSAYLLWIQHQAGFSGGFYRQP